MNAFSGGIEIMSVINPESMAVFSAAVSYCLEHGNRVYLWETASVTPVMPASKVNGEITPPRLLYPSRMASIVEMAKMARFADFSRREGSAMKQLQAYVYLGVYWLNHIAHADEMVQAA
jgi:hypothetical protein